MSNKETDKLDEHLAELAANAGKQLRDGELDLPSDVNERLAAARREAVALVDQRAGQQNAIQNVFSNPRRWAGVGVMAAAVLVVAVMLRAPSDSMPVADDLDLVVAQEAELLEELEFVAWIVAMDDEQPNAG